MHFEQNEVLAFDATVKELLRPLLTVLEDNPGATELCVNRPGEIYIEVGADWRRYERPEITLPYCLSLATAIATYTEQEINPAHPILSAMLPGGERMQIVIPPAVEQGTVSFSIRIPSASIKSLDDYEAEGAFSRFVWAKSPYFETRKHELPEIDQELCACLASNRLKQFINLAVKARKNIAFVGNTGSGKTTLMKSACQAIPTSERLTTIEDVREIFLPQHPNRVHLLYSKGGQGVANVTPAALIASNMRMKPDRVLLAELRGSEAYDFLKLLTTGHSGSITTFHAESCALAYERYVFMCKEHDNAAIYDAAALKHLVTLTIDIIIHLLAQNHHDVHGQPVIKERYVAEVHYDPIAKLIAQFGNATLHHAESSSK
jgi:type IV secretion system protein VirB11